MQKGMERRTRAFVAIELVVVVAVIAVLLGLGYSVYRGARLSARVAAAECNLRQIGTGFGLFFQKYGCYPPQGANLVAVLAPFLRDNAVFRNPLAEEDTPGAAFSSLYIEPRAGQLDSPNSYVSALVTADGSTAVILKTHGIVERQDGLTLPADNPALTAKILAFQCSCAEGVPITDEDGDEGDFEGLININPSENDEFEFYMVLNDGTEITRDMLHEDQGSLSLSQGKVKRVVFKPKGNGNQSTLTYKGRVSRLENKNRYTIEAKDDYFMDVDLFSSKAGRGKAMGKWWMSIDAKKVNVSICTCGAESAGACTCGK